MSVAFSACASVDLPVWSGRPRPLPLILVLVLILIYATHNQR